MSSFFGLPLEMREEIYECCSREDIFNLSLCCKQTNEEVKQIIWSRVGLSWTALRPCSKNEALNLKYTKSLKIEVWNHENFEEKSDTASNFHDLINNLSPERLKHVSFRGFQVHDGIPTIAARYPLLEALRLHDLRHYLLPNWQVSSFTELTYLLLYCCDIQDSQLTGICRLKNLRVLYVIHCYKLTGLSLQYISDVSSLTLLNYTNGDEISDLEFAETLPKLKNLTELMLADSGVGIQFFSRAEDMIRNMKVLDLSFTNIDDKCFAYIFAAEHLKELKVQSCDITDEALKGLTRYTRLTRLESLNLILCDGISDVGIKYVCRMPSLRRLLLADCEGLTDLALSYIGKYLFLLEELDISCPAFTDAGLMHLSELEYLHKIGYDYDEYGDQVTEEGRVKAGLPVFLNTI